MVQALGEGLSFSVELLLVPIDFFIALKVFVEGVLGPLDLCIFCLEFRTIVLVKVIKLI